MSQFVYKALSLDGKHITDRIEAVNAASVAEHLERLHLIPIVIKEKKNIFFFTKKTAHVEPKAVIVFTKQLATLYKAGVPLLACLEALEEQAGSLPLKSVIRQMINDLQNGQTLYEALKTHPTVFSELYINMVRIGEVGGVLDEVLFRLVGFLTYDFEMRQNIKKATRYPMIVLTGIVAAFVILILLVVPRFVDIFQKMHIELPLPTRILIGINSALTTYGYIFIPALIILVLAMRRFIHTPSGRRWWDTRKMKLPVFGLLNIKTYISRFAKTFETLNKSGVPILQALHIIAETVDNTILAEEIQNAAVGVEEGLGLSAPLSKSTIFPPMVVQMIAIGEKSGALDTMMSNIAAYYDEEVDYTVKNLTTLIEPLITVALGGVILFIALSIFMPMWNMLGNMGGH